MNTTTKHELTEACVGVHCHSCHVDEPDEGAYIVCIECGHVYRTAGELRRAYRRALTQITFSRPTTGSFDALFDMPPPSIRTRCMELWGWLLSRFVRARSIFFCQECTHDF